MKKTIAILGCFISLLLCLFIGTSLGSPEIGIGLFAIDITAAIIAYYTPSFRLFMRYNIYSACGTVSAAILYSCTDPLVGGTVDVMYLANRLDIASLTKDGSNALLVTAITMVATKKFYKLEGQTGQNGSSVGARFKMVPLPFGKAFEHEIDALAFKIDPATKKEIEAWNQADIVAIVQGKHKGTAGNCAFEIYGADGGLQIIELERDPNDKDTLGAFKIKFKTQENSREPHMPYTFFTTDYATTLAAVNALL